MLARISINKEQGINYDEPQAIDNHGQPTDVHYNIRKDLITLTVSDCEIQDTYINFRNAFQQTGFKSGIAELNVSGTKYPITDKAWDQIQKLHKTHEDLEQQEAGRGDSENQEYNNEEYREEYNNRDDEVGDSDVRWYFDGEEH